MLTSVF